MTRWIRFDDNGEASFAILQDELVAPVSGAPFGEWKFTGQKRKLSDVRLLPPVEPRSFYACGFNYDGHARAMALKLNQPLRLPESPEIGYRATSALIAHGDTIVIPADATENIHYEAELVVVIGKKVKQLSEAEALSCVFGYTIGNDISERSWQKSDRSGWRAKNADTFKPMGPWIETDIDLPKMRTKVFVNGSLTIEFATESMIFGIAPVISAISRYMTLYPGDVIWMGTDGASVNLKHGDVVDIELTGLGTLRNPLVRAGLS
jgi:2-keto-4-pentenoate hydratase/2-oxohepta-3-ene-1,7-dioic acid hydratase in catechol pathway